MESSRYVSSKKLTTAEASYNLIDGQKEKQFKNLKM